MGNKRRNKKNRGSKRYNQPLPPLDPNFKQQLYQEALEGINLIKSSKAALVQKQAQQAYLLSKAWLDTWKVHVGYDAILKGENPGGRKYGRQQILEINLDLLSSDPCYDIPEANCYKELAVNLRDVQPAKDYILVTEEVWTYFHTKYGGQGILRIANAQGEFNLKLIMPWVVVMDHETINAIKNCHQNQLQNKASTISVKRVQVWGDWTIQKLQSYFKEMWHELFDIWVLDPHIEVPQHLFIILKSIHSNKFHVCGKKLGELTIPLSQYVRNNFTLFLCQKDQFDKLYQAFQPGNSGLCFRCGSKTNLGSFCACKEAYYCGSHCRYLDQEFHSQICLKSYDSDDDDEFDALQAKDLENLGVGLVNMGNTCYMNSSLQSLFSPRCLIDYFASKKYWPNGVQKRQIQLNYKFEKLLKQLFTKKQSVTPHSFRNQLAKKYPAFGNNYQQDAAEFILYLLDGMNEELIVKDQQQQFPQEALQFADADAEAGEQKQQEQESDSDSDQDEQDQEKENEPKEAQNAPQMMQFKKKELQQDIQDLNQAWDSIQKQNSKFLIDNFMGMMQSEILCPICEGKTRTFEPFTTLSLSLEQKYTPQFKELDIFVIFDDWYAPFAHKIFKYSSSTIMMDLKKEIADEVGIDPQKFMAATSTAFSLQKFLFHDEDRVEMVVKESEGYYLCLFELPLEAQLVTEQDQYFDVMINSYEKKNPYSAMPENIPASIPKLLLINRNETPSQIYNKVFEKLKGNSRAEQINELIPAEAQEPDILMFNEVRAILKYQVYIETRLPAKTNCPFTCKKYYKKEIKHHSCELPLNNSKKLDEYLKDINYKDSHTSLNITFDQGHTPNELKSELPPLQNKKQGHQGCHIEDLLAGFEAAESLFGENSYYCSICKDQTFANKVMTLQRVPRQLIVQLKRFQFDVFKGVFSKNKILVTYPDCLKICQIPYKLYAVILHYGNLDNGHYVAYCLRQERWFEFNDEKVSELQMKDVLNDSNAYILFYEQDQ